MWEIGYCSDLSGCWLEQEFGRLVAHIGMNDDVGISYYASFCVDNEDEWFSIEAGNSLDDAKEIAEAVAVQWIFDEHERGLSALEAA